MRSLDSEVKESRKQNEKERKMQILRCNLV